MIKEITHDNMNFKITHTKVHQTVIHKNIKRQKQTIIWRSKMLHKRTRNTKEEVFDTHIKVVESLLCKMYTL